MTSKDTSNRETPRIPHTYEIDEVAKIDKLCFLNHWDSSRIKNIEKHYNTTLLVYGKKKITAYVLYQLVSHEYRIMRIGVHPDCQRQGLASILIKTILKKAKSRRREIKVAVPEVLLSAQLFFKSLGFKAYKIESDRSPETMYFMKRGYR